MSPLTALCVVTFLHDIRAVQINTSMHSMICRLETRHALRHRVVQGQANGGWALDEAVVFGRYDLFAKRCRKLVSLFTTIHQFSLLAQVIQLLTLFITHYTYSWHVIYSAANFQWLSMLGCLLLRSISTLRGWRL